MEQSLFEAIRVFLEKRKKCTNVAIEVPLDGGRADIIGGRFILSKDKKASEGSIVWTRGRYVEVELHLIELKKENDDIIKGIGELFWYKFLLKDVWCDRLFLYLLVDKYRLEEKEIEFIKSCGFGILEMEKVNGNIIIDELVTPKMYECKQTSVKLSSEVRIIYKEYKCLEKVFRNINKALKPIEEELNSLSTSEKTA